MISYAQNFEDVMLWRALGHIKDGFYIDIGAQDPIVDSVSLTFYEQGWKGISVEATHFYASLLRLNRPHETIIQAAVNDRSGMITFYEIPDTGLSTGDYDVAETHRLKGFNIVETVVPCITLSEVFAQVANKDVHWLKIDVEGMESNVLNSWGDSDIRPWVVIVESTFPNTKLETYSVWESTLLERGYDFVYFDGLSRYYVIIERQDIAKKFSTPPNIFDGFSIAISTPYGAIARQQLNKVEEEKLALFNQFDDKERLNQLQFKEKELALENELQNKQHTIVELEKAYSDIDIKLINAKSEFDKAQLAFKASADKILADEKKLAANELQKYLDKERAYSQLVIKVQNEAYQDAQNFLHQFSELRKDFQHEVRSLKVELNKTKSESAANEQLIKETAAKELKETQTLLANNIQQQLEAEQNFNKKFYEIQKETNSTISLLQENFLKKERLAESELLELKEQLKDVSESRELIATKLLDSEILVKKYIASEDVLQNLLKTQKNSADIEINKLAGSEIKLKKLIELQETQFKKLVTLTKKYKELIDSVYNSLTWKLLHPKCFNLNAINNNMTENLHELLSVNSNEFINIAYQKILGRSVDATGYQYYLGRLEVGIDRIHVLAQIRNSKEAKSRNFDMPDLDRAIKSYKLKKIPFLGPLFMLFSLIFSSRNIATVENQLPHTIKDFANPNNHDFIQEAYQKILGRSVDATGYNYYIKRLNSGIPKIQVLMQLRNSKEGKLRNLKMPDLDKAIKDYRSENWPFIGWFFRWLNRNNYVNQDVGLDEVEAIVKEFNQITLDNMSSYSHLMETEDSSGLIVNDHIDAIADTTESIDSKINVVIQPSLLWDRFKQAQVEKDKYSSTWDAKSVKTPLEIYGRNTLKL